MKDLIAPFLSPLHRLWAGFLLMIPFLIIQNLQIKGAALFLLFILLFLSGKQFRPLPNFLLFFSIVFFQLLTPSGEVLWQSGVFMITRDALEKGISRGMTLTGLIFISLISVRPGLGGSDNSLLTRTFYFFSRFMDSREALKNGEKTHLFTRLDSLLLEVYFPEKEKDEP